MAISWPAVVALLCLAKTALNWASDRLAFSPVLGSMMASSVPPGVPSPWMPLTMRASSEKAGS